mmetsp:Transcript_30161/g.61605  ORF Transcript_30161/g.61605 Transcript_30161/m.61605 type:complete len:713 (+) Transcript_30161:201-2339(+)
MMVTIAAKALAAVVLVVDSFPIVSSFSAKLLITSNQFQCQPKRFTSSKFILSSQIWASNSENELSATEEPEIGTTWVGTSSGKPEDGKSLVDLDIGIDGKSYGIGALSKQMHDALTSVAKKRGSDIPDELKSVYLLYAMDASAKEVVKATLENSGFVMNLGDDPGMEDIGQWGSVDMITLLDSVSGEAAAGSDGRKIYSSWSDAITKGGWSPGQGYSFVVRNVPSRVKGVDLGALLKSMDPDGTLAQEAKEKGILMPYDDVESLADLASDCMQRVRAAPQGATDEKDAYIGDDDKGYNVISRSSMLLENRNLDGSENFKTLLHVMDSLANHGCLVVDLTDGDKSHDSAKKMSNMWRATESLFKNAKDEGVNLPSMHVADGVGSSHAVVGFQSVNDGDQQFLETRLRRLDGILLPEESHAAMGEGGAESMTEAFRIMAEVGKDVVRIATAASSFEAGAFQTVGSVVSDEGDDSPSIAGLTFEEASASGIWEEDEDGFERGASKRDISRSKILASEAADLLTKEIMDDGRPLLDSDVEHNEGSVSMSPHRMCKYSNCKKSKKSNTREIFGAHTDTSFVTIVPAASVSGLEVFDEDSLQWYRPELRARKHSKQLDPAREKDELFPWHCRYLIVMPGELLQITSRNNIPASVHRVVASTDRPRMSAPVLLRARPGTTMNVERYMGSLEKADGLLKSCHGMKMEDIHDALQASPTQP